MELHFVATNSVNDLMSSPHAVSVLLRAIAVRGNKLIAEAECNVV